MKIFFIGPIQSSFVKNDIIILSKEHTLFLENSNIGKGIKGLLGLLYISIKSIFKVIRSDAIFCWFADYTTLVPVITAKIFGKKSYVIAGGFDVGYIPDLNYGARARLLRWFCVKNTFRFASLIFPVSKFAENGLHRLTEGKHAPSKIIYNGVVLDKFFSYNKLPHQRKYIITVSQADNRIEYIRKGSDKYIRIAAQMPAQEFILAGLRGEALEKAKKEAEGITNLKILPGPISLYEELAPLYYLSYAYLQLSLEETFGVAVIEAMSCGCMPIVTCKGALPEIIIDDSYIAESDETVINLIVKSLSLSEEERMKFKEHTKKFALSIREKELLLSLIVKK